MAAGNWLRASTIRHVAKVAIAALAAFALSLGGRNEFALFSAMGAAMVVGSSLGEDLSSSLNRVRGTLAGTAVGLGCALPLGSSLWSIGVASAGLAWLCTGLGWGAAAMRIGLAMALVILFTHGGDPAHYALWRVANTLVGVLIGLAVGRLLWPIRGRDRIGTAIDRLQAGIAASLEALAGDAKPEALLARVILAASRPDDLVLDPFCGTGTTGAVAKRLGRRFIGIERDAGYAAAAQARIASVAPLPEPALAPFQTAREAPRVPFAALIERGLVLPGARLCDAKRKVKALVRADGAIALGETVGSIHRIGALAQGLEACNGWAFWHLETTKGLVSIDAFRAEIRAEMGPR